MRAMTATLALGSLLGLATLSSVAPAEEAAPERAIDPKADALLRKMSDDLANLKSFRFDARHVTEVVTEDGQKIQLLASSTVAVQRPDKLRSDRKGRFGDVTLYYDGDNLTVYGKRENLYATAKAPPTLEATIDFARDELGLEAPAADLLYTDAYAALTEDVVSGSYIDQAELEGRTCDHLAFRGNETDWEIWIEDGPRALPCRFVITSKKVKGSPEHTVELFNWQVDAPLPAARFKFSPPRDAGKIEFFNIAKRQRQPVKGVRS